MYIRIYYLLLLIMFSGCSIGDSLSSNVEINETTAMEYQEMSHEELMVIVNNPYKSLELKKILCTKFAKEHGKDECFQTLSDSTGNYSFCSEIKDDKRQYSCFNQFAAKGDISLCYKIENMEYRNDCLGIGS